MAGLSLVFYDLEKVFGVPLMLPGGLLFLAVVATVLHTPLMSFVGLALLAVSGTLALGRMGRRANPGPYAPPPGPCLTQ